MSAHSNLLPRLPFLALLAGCLLAALPALAAAPAPEATSIEEVWITLGEDAFAVARQLPSVHNGGEALPRLGANEGVVLSRVPRAQLAALAEQIHHELRRCGGFMLHESLAAGQAELARIGAASRSTGGLPFTIDQPLWVERVAEEVDPANILATMTTLSTNFANRYHLHPSGTAAANWIRDLWAGYAAERPDIIVRLVTHPTAVTPQPSVVLTIPGTTLADEIVVVGGHLDSTASGTSNPNFSAPGADDDASGIATISETLRAVLASGFQPQRTLEFMAYAAEEVGLRGSADIAGSYQTAGANVVAMLQQDMTGLKGSAEDIALISDFTNPTLTAFLGDLLDTYQPDLLWTTSACGYGCSDHASWHRNGYPASFAFESRFGQHNSQIHKPGDTVATLGNNAVHAAKFARLAAAFLVEAGLDGPEILFEDGFESGDASAWSLSVNP